MGIRIDRVLQRYVSLLVEEAKAEEGVPSLAPSLPLQPGPAGPVEG